MLGRRLVTLGALVLAVHVFGRTSFAAEGDVFCKTPETVAIWEMNRLGLNPGELVQNGTVIPDVSGNGRDAIVKGAANNLQVLDGAAEFPGNTSVGRTGGGGPARLEVEDDRAFEFGPEDDFSIELFVRREEVAGTANWGILAGTWHSRTTLDDTVDPIAAGAWYGYGFIRHNEAGGWRFTTSPINPDGTFTPSFNEIASSAFEIPAGLHYVIASVDRTAGMATIYLDGQQITQVAVAPGVAFISPTGYEPARFSFLTGVDDSTRPAYRESPTGYAIDAARVMRRTIGFEEAFDNWIGLTDGETIPLDCGGTCSAVATASNRRPLVGECVLFSAANSSAQEGATITKYEWRIGAGNFAEGAVSFERSFALPTPAEGIEVAVRITDSTGCSSTNTVNIVVSNPLPVASIQARLGEESLAGNPILLLQGDVLTLDGTGSRTPVSPSALLCPLVDNVPLPPPEITDYRWDLDSNGTVDRTQDTFDLGPLKTLGAFKVTLTVVNDARAQASASLNFEVIAKPDVEPGPPGRIFRATPDTIGLWEFNDLELQLDEALPNDLVVPDLSGNGLDATVEANDGGQLALKPGDARFGDENTSAGKVSGGGARVVVNNDGDAFEMGPDQSFSIELYVRREVETGTQNWGILAGTWHSRTQLVDGGDPIANGAWYGYGFIRDVDNGGWLLNSSPINADGTFNFGFNEIKTSPPIDIPAGTHYLVGTVDRITQRANVYLDGVLRAGVGLPAGQAFITPPEYDHARMMFFAGEDDLSLNSYREAPSGYGIDAARVTSRALTAEEIAENYRLIRAGVSAPAPEAPEISVSPASLAFGQVQMGSAALRSTVITNTGNAPLKLSSIALAAGSSAAYSITQNPGAVTVPPQGTATVEVRYAPTAVGPDAGTLEIKSDDADEGTVAVALSGEGTAASGVRFVRGDTNADGSVNIADASYLLNFLFLGGPDPKCAATADANADGGGNIADASFILNFLFLGGRDIPAPNACGQDPAADPADCASFPPCAG
jgi:hypothetical protein